VRAAFGAVYADDNAEGVFTYLAHLQGARFRECLVTAAPALPGWCRCPHLTKYVFGLWLSGTAARWSAPELRKRQLALLVELFHRAGQRPAWRATRRRTPEEWLRAECPLPDAVLGLPTPDQARDVRLAGVTHALAIAPRVSLFADFGLDHAPVQGAACFQFTLASATAMVRGLARLSGLATDCWDLAPARLASVLEAAEVPDNLRRAADARYALALAPADYDRRATAAALRDFTREALEAARSELAVRYPLAAAAAHYSSVPTPLPAEHVAAYRSGHGVDLAEALGLAPTGLSTVACCVPSCPHYLRPLGRPRRGPSGQFALHPRLRAHLDAAGAVPGLHKTAHALQVLDGGDAVVRAHADVVASLVEGGHCLQTDRGPGADKIEAQIRALEDREGGGRQWPERRSRLLAVLREHAEDDAARYRARLLARLAGALRRNGGDEWLTAYVRCVLDRYRAAPFDWAYTDFEAAVMGVI